ncbi:hypothetical protein, partial [Nocardia sp. NPDC004722]
DRYPTCTALADAATRVLSSARGERTAHGNPRNATTLATPPRQEFVATLPAARAGLPDSIRTALDSPHPEIRQGAVHALGTLLSSSDEVRADTARKALRDIAISDVPVVASAAREILGGASTMDSPRLPAAGRPDAGSHTGAQDDSSAAPPGEASPMDLGPDPGGFPSRGTPMRASGKTVGSLPSDRPARRGIGAQILAFGAGLLAMAAGLLQLLGPHPTNEIPDFATFLDRLSVIAIGTGATVFVPALRRRFGPGLVAGAALTAVWGTVGLVVRLRWLQSHGLSVDPKSHGLALTVTGAIVLAGVCAGGVLLLDTGGRLGFAVPRRSFPIATVSLGAVAAISAFLGIAHYAGWQAFIGERNSPWWVIPPVLLAAAPTLLAFLTPRPAFTAVTVGWALGVYALGAVGDPLGEVPYDTPAGLFAGGPTSLLFLLIPGAIALVNLLDFRAAAQE